nr:MAG TPA: hypothetical protein [Caudoviricetes sp.]
MATEIKAADFRYYPVLRQTVSAGYQSVLPAPG